MIRRLVQTAFATIGAFSLLALTAYVVLWQQTNQDLRIAGGSALLFLLALICAPDRGATLGVTFLFSGFHWFVVALFSAGIRELVAALALLLVPAVIVGIAALKERSVAHEVLSPAEEIRTAS